MDSYMPDITVYEVYMSAYDVTAWRDGAVYRTAFRETSWFPQSQVNANRPRASRWNANSRSRCWMNRAS